MDYGMILVNIVLDKKMNDPLPFPAQGLRISGILPINSITKQNSPAEQADPADSAVRLRGSAGRYDKERNSLYGQRKGITT